MHLLLDYFTFILLHLKNRRFRRMKRLTTVIIAAVFSIGLANSQVSKSRDWSEKIFIGGNLGASIGTITNINISPMIGYKFNPKTIAGVTLTYQYYKQKFPGGGEYKTNIYGGGLFARQYLLNESLGPVDNIFLHTEYEGLNYAAYDALNGEHRKWLYTGLLGGGVQSGPLTISALFILNRDRNNSPYGTEPYVIRIGVGF
jgi:hypothetical protein